MGFRVLAILIAGLLSFGIAVIGDVRADDMSIINEESYYPEQPIFYRGNLYYAEMGKDRVIKWDGKRNAAFWTRQGCGPTSVARGTSDTLIVLCHLQNRLARIDLQGKTVKIFDRDNNGQGFGNPNGSVNDAKGGVYFSSSGQFGDQAPATGAVYYLGRDDSVRKVADNIWYSNGVALSHDGKKLFVSEHLGRKVLVYDVKGDA